MNSGGAGTGDGSGASGGFVHLHVHTEYSMLDGAARLPELFAAAAEQKMPALAMTDHGNVFGAYDFYKQGRKHGVKPIIGMEGYLTPGTHRSDRTRVKWGNGGEDDISGGGAYTHLTMLAEDNVGMNNLFRLASLASLEGYYYKPRMDRELLNTYSKGIIATTGCPSGEIQTLLRLGKYDRACEVAGEFRDIFGAENYYLELLDHGLPIEARVQPELLRLGRALGLPLVATNDLHYTHAADAAAHGVLLCVQSGATLADPNRFKFDADDFYLKTAAQMREQWAEFPEACDNTLLIAERCNISFPDGADYMPTFPVPEGHSEHSWFVSEVEIGLHRRYPHGISTAARTQADYESDIILQMGFPSYFLVVADFIAWAKNNGIRVGPGRGSAAGSLVAYALGITDVDPLKHKLLFERFLNPERISKPDIDIDFDEIGRSEVIRYVTDKYGSDRVAQIVTYGTIKAKQAVKDSARVLGYPYGVGDRITKVMPRPVLGKDLSLSAIFDPTHDRYGEGSEFRELFESDNDVRSVVETARGLENLKRQWGVHAAGVIMSSVPLLDVIPIMKREADGSIITQFDYPTCEALGLVKMDFLGLRNLSILQDALDAVQANRGITLNLDDLEPWDDQLTYDLLSRGDTLGVFQLDGGPMRDLLRRMAPNCFEDISAVLALYRPGPMAANAHNDYADRKNGRQERSPIHPELAEPLAPILADTYGVIVYQEQVMAIAQVVAGYSLGQADLLRRAMGKKKKEILDKEFPPFEAGMLERGYSRECIDALWAILVPFADYAFNKSHTVAYGLVSYWTAWLKANYQAEYMSALLTSVSDDKDKMAVYLAEARRMGITVLPPDVNQSVTTFAAVGTDVRFGMSAVRNVGTAVVEAIVAARRETGEFTDFADFLTRVDAVVCNKRTVESLIKAGAFDSLGHTRRGLILVHETAVDGAMQLKRAEAIGQFDLFGMASDDSAGSSLDLVIPDHEWDRPTLLSQEREMLGLYVSSHPLSGVEHVLATMVDHPVAALRDDDTVQDRSVVTIGGLVTNVVRKTSRDGNLWAVVTVEDLTAAVDVRFFNRTWQMYGPVLHTDAVVVVKGRLEKGDDGVSMSALECTLPDLSVAGGGPITLTVAATKVGPEIVSALKEVLTGHPGMTEVRLAVASPGRTMVMRLDATLRVDPSPALFGELKAVLGPNCMGTGR